MHKFCKEFMNEQIISLPCLSLIIINFLEFLVEMFESFLTPKLEDIINSRFLFLGIIKFLKISKIYIEISLRYNLTFIPSIINSLGIIVE